MTDNRNDIGNEASNGAFPFSVLVFAAAGGAALGLIIWGWMQYGESIYLTRLTAFVAGCF
ncbi:MAG: hypothetical protein LJE67_15900 [Salaquimonas sp.]|jgi:hypothetical protein|nr:hypothetical protein [Salaquimonas sp.]